MPPITPQEAAQIAYILSAWATGAVIQKDPSTLPGLTALGNSFIGIGSGKSTPLDVGNALKLFISELNTKTTGTQIPGLSTLISATLSQVNAANSPLTPNLLSGLVGTILTTVGNGILFGVSQASTPTVVPTPAVT